jgi:hypothetical protein
MIPAPSRPLAALLVGRDAKHRSLLAPCHRRAIIAGLIDAISRAVH